MMPDATPITPYISGPRRRATSSEAANARPRATASPPARPAKLRIVRPSAVTVRARRGRKSSFGSGCPWRRKLPHCARLTTVSGGPPAAPLMMPFGNSNVDALLALIRCPDCLGELRRASPSADNVDRLECAGCGSVWPVRFGIPDLRGGRAVDPYLTNDEDLRAAERLHD